jgi:hypothetical protein
MRRWAGLFVLAMAAMGLAQKKAVEKITVPVEPVKSAIETTFVDKKTGVSFRVPPGWELSRKDGQVSTFHMDARTAMPTAKMRAVAVMDFNPYPQSTLSGASFYFSVQPKTTDVACARQASKALSDTDVKPIGNMVFTHGHDEHGGICTEARDEVYTAYRRHSCYRFDLVMNTFCAISSGARDVTEAQIQSIDQRMGGILSTVRFAWEK